MKIIEDLVRKENIDCDLTFTRSYDMYLDENQLKKVKTFYDSLVDQGLDFMDDVKYLSQSETRDVSWDEVLGLFCPSARLFLMMFALRRHMSETPREASVSQQAISGLTNSSPISFVLPFPTA